ncbi:MAG: aldehyde:ferredoxin oxidoreductase [Spirochaetes bacterium]|nr:MAG: aldehyde:ferredoxin oxidoreductase [Spirochaetota bacterium]
MKGVFGKILNINLTSKIIEEENIPDDIYRNYLGGKGLGAYLLLKKNPAGVNPLSPDNNIIFAVGPACGFKIWGANRYGAFTKSPLTGIFSESYAGGKAFLQFSRIGYDAVVINGACERWSYIVINNEKVEYKKADFLLGKDSLETELILKEKYKGLNPAVLTIGPAGENLVKYAYVNNDQGRSLGRTGIGAILGSKKVKAIVVMGNIKKEAADPQLLSSYAKEQLEIGRQHPGTKAYNKTGTSLVVDLTTAVDAFPARYWQQGSVPHRDKINAEALHRELDVKPKACLYCFIACTRSSTVKYGRHKGLKLDGPEYETIDAFGGLNMVDDIKEIAFLNDICDRLGLDTVTAGNTTAFAIEAYKRGKIDFEIDYGEVDRIAELLRMISVREGIGDLLAEGVRSASIKLGMEDIAIHVKGLEPPGYDPRTLQGMGLGYAVSDRGACHLRATFYKAELSGQIDPLENNGKAKLFLEYEDRLTIYDTLILCRFFRDLLYYDELATIVKSSMGIELEEKDFKEISDRIAHSIRMFNLREGMDPSQDWLPEYFFKNPIGAKNIVLNRDKFGELIGDYYKLRGF